jgi:hypothetical protein
MYADGSNRPQGICLSVNSLSVRPSDRMVQLKNRWTDVHETWYELHAVRAMVQAVSRWPHTAEARVRPTAQSLCDLWWTNWQWDRFSPISSVFPCQYIIPPLLHLPPPHELCDISDQAAHYHTVGPKLGASSLTRYLDGA